MNSNTNSNGDASRAFAEHVKQTITNLPPITKLLISAPVLILLLDIFTSSILHLFSISYWFVLDVDSIIKHWQIQRLFLYPISTRGFVEVLITTIWLFPELYKAEKKMGSIRVLWLLGSLLTVAPAITYIFLVELMKAYAPEFNYGNLIYFGMGGWVVGLVIVNYFESDANNDNDNQRMIAGVISIPNKVWPAIVLVFFVILAPGSSFILNLSSAFFATLYGLEKLPSYFTLTDETISHYEEKAWLRFITQSPNFVSASSRGVYLPIFSNPSRFNSSTAAEPAASSSSPSFPGTGVRLGS